MDNSIHITDVKQRKINVTFIAIGIFIGFLLTSFLFVSLTPADAKSDVVNQVRENQSHVYATTDKAISNLRESIDQLEYIKASMHENAKKLDFQRE
jgi:hypothetical protein